jgi:hypothetical protein
VEIPLAQPDEQVRQVPVRTRTEPE